MWWLAIPVILYTAGLLTLWFILVRHNSEAPPAGAGSHLVELPAGEDLPGAGLPEGKDLAEAGSVSGGGPRVSVVVAARDEEKNITRLLESLEAQNYPADHL